MKAPVGLLSDGAVLRSKMEGLCPDKFAFAKRSAAMKSPVGTLSDRTVLRSKMEGLCPDKFRFVGYKCSASSTSFTMFSDTCPGALACPGLAKVIAEPKVSPARRLTAPSAPMLMVMTGVSG